MKRSDIVNTINNLKGEDGHKKVLEVYNAQNPLPRGYKVQEKDPWCATTVSAVYLMNGYPDIAECSCVMMIQKAKKLGIWVEDDAYIPQPGDIVMYDWQDSGKGDDQGTADHTGIVISVTKSKITVREGNKNKTLGNRDILVDGLYVRGYITPKFEEEKKPVANTSAKEKKPKEKAQNVSYEVGKVYTITVKSALNVRIAPGLQYRKVLYKDLTSDAKKHAIGSALKNGTKVTCQKIQKDGNNIWMKIPSGWICAKLNDNIYVK